MAQVSTMTGKLSSYHTGTNTSKSPQYNKGVDFVVGRGSQRVGKATGMRYSRYLHTDILYQK